MQRTVFDYVMCNEHKPGSHGNSPRKNGLMKFRDVDFNDTCVLFYFCSIFIN